MDKTRTVETGQWTADGCERNVFELVLNSQGHDLARVRHIDSPLIA
jgi:hypothetical protein